MLAHIRYIGNHLEGFIAHILRMRGGEADTHMRYGSGHKAEEGREVDDFTVLLKAIGIDILTEEGYFLIALGREVEHFVEDAFHIAAPFTSTSVRNDAIVAEIVTTTHNAHKARNVIATNAGRNHIAISLCSRKLYVDGLLTGFYRCYQFRKRKISIRSYHEIHVMIVNQVLLGTFGHTSEDTHDELVLLAPLAVHCVEELQAVEDFLFGIVADGASVHKHRIGLVQRIAHTIARHLHNGSHHFTVGHIHLAAVRLDKEFLLVGC